MALVPIIAINTYVGYKNVKAKDALEVEQIDTTIEEVVSSSELDYTFDIGNNDGIVTGNENNNVLDVLNLCKEINVPMVLDYHHHLCNNNNLDINIYLKRIINTLLQIIIDIFLF